MSARLVFFAAMVLAPLPAAAQAPPDPLPLYGPEMVFSVWRSGSEIGRHRVLFSRDGGALIVRSMLDLAVKMLGITVYRYTYRAQEVWRDGKLVRLVSSVDDNGTPAKIEAQADQDKIDVAGPHGRFVADAPILPSTHWDAQVIGADRVINTLDGKIDQVKLVPEGAGPVATAAAPIRATHYLWTGDIKAETWYDAAGHWVKLRFNGKDGTPIDYLCVRCTAPAAK